MNMSIYRSLSILGVAATALTGVALASGIASASSGGGCGAASYGATACDSASGNQVNYDMYVTSNGVPNNCIYITLTIRDDTTGKADRVTFGCGGGYDGPLSVLGLNGHRYHSSAQVWTPTGPLTPSVSPELTSSY